MSESVAPLAPVLSLCIVNCEDAVGGACVPELYQSAFGRDPSRERWTVVETAKTGVLPVDGVHDVIILTGSHLNVEDNLPWMEPLCQFLRGQARRESHPDGESRVARHTNCAGHCTPVFIGSAVLPRIVGICFGAQLIAHAFGGEVAPNPGGRFILRLEDLTPTTEWAELPGAEGLARSTAGVAVPCAQRDPLEDASSMFMSTPLRDVEGMDCPASQLRGIESHGFCVSRLPPGAVRLASSASCVNEVFILGRNVLAFQCHPEFTIDVVAQKLWPNLVEQHKRLSAAEAADSGASFARPTNNGALREFVRSFCGLTHT